MSEPKDRDDSEARELDRALLGFMLEYSGDAISVLALDGTILAVSKAVESLFGYSAEEMVGKNVNSVFPLFTTAELIEAENKIVARAAAGEEIAPYESTRIRKDGSTLHIRVLTRPVWDARGRNIAVARIIRDISERKAHEQDKALLGQIVNSSSDAIISFSLDGTITSWNPAAERIYGYTAAEMVGTSLKARVGEFVSPERIAEELKIAERVAAGEHIQPFEAVRTRKDGTKVNVLVSNSPIRDAHGTVVGVARTVRDISERKKHEEQKALLSAIVESSNDAIYTKTLEGTITSWNPAAEALFGYAAGEIIGQSVLSLFSPDKVLEESEMVARIRAGESIRQYETVRVRRDGTRIQVSITVSALRGPGNEIVGVSNTVRDITERKATEARLKSMQDDLIHVGRLNELGQVSAGIAHELNQPLTAMLNYSNIAKRLIAKEEPSSYGMAYEAVSKAADQAVRAAEIIRRMRAFVEKRDSNRTIEDVNAVVKDTMALGFMGADAANVTTRIELAPDLPPVLVDRVQVQQVLVNLLHNAVDAMAESKKRELTVTTKPADTGVEIAVADTGPGIPKELLGRLFMPFFTTKPGGMGIGLVISQSIVQAHGGKISVASSGGGGTVFRFTLPAKTMAA